MSHTTTHAYTRNKGWVRPASEHTVNIADHWLTNWWMGYLKVDCGPVPAPPRAYEVCKSSLETCIGIMETDGLWIANGIYAD